jgi:hypothetical protein
MELNLYLVLGVAIMVVAVLIYFSEPGDDDNG